MALFYSRNTCRLCKSARLWTAVPLTPLPVASPNVGSATGQSETAPADLLQCEECGFLQLGSVVDPEFQYRNFKYHTGISLGLTQHFETLVDALAARGEIGPSTFVFDIGSNDGSLLALAKKHGARVMGIDPAVRIAEAASARGIPTIGDFFSKAMASRIVSAHGRAQVIFSNNTIANIDDLDDFFAGVTELMDPAGMLTVETQYAVDVIEKMLLDVIYHEHISYFTVGAMARFLDGFGLELFDAERIAPKGGSIRFSVQAKGGRRPISPRVNELIRTEEGVIRNRDALREFRNRIDEIGAEIRSRMADSRARTGRSIAYGSSVGCAALIHFLRLHDHIDAVFDDTPLVNAIHTPRGALPVHAGSQLENEPPTDVLVLAWRYAGPIAEKHQAYRKRGGRFFRALPDLAYVS